MALGKSGWMRKLVAVAAVVLAFAGCAGGEDTDETGDEEAAQTAAIQSIGDLQAGDVVGVQEGTTGEEYAEKELTDEGVQLRPFPEGPDAYAALEACNVDAVVNDEGTAVSEVEAREGALEIVQTIDTKETYGIAVDPANKPLLEAINAALAQIIDDGTYEEIFAKYPDLPPGGSVAEGADVSAPPKPPDFETNQPGTLLVGSDIPYPPFEMREAGKLTGFDIDLVNEIAERLGVEVQYKDTDFDTIFIQLAAGRYDSVASATTITPAREKKVNFSDPYYNSQQSLTVNPEC